MKLTPFFDQLQRLISIVTEDVRPHEADKIQIFLNSLGAMPEYKGVFIQGLTYNSIEEMERSFDVSLAKRSSDEEYGIHQIAVRVSKSFAIDPAEIERTMIRYKDTIPANRMESIAIDAAIQSKARCRAFASAFRLEAQDRGLIQ